MMRLQRNIASALLLAGLLWAGPVRAQIGLELSLLGTFDGGQGEGAAEISAYDPANQQLYVVNSTHGGLDIVDLSDPAAPVLITTVDISSFGASANSVAVKNGIVAVAVAGEAIDANGTVVLLDASGDVLGSAEIGVLPDMLTFTPDGTKVLVANEGQPSDDYLTDPEGSVSIIDVATRTVRTADFAAFNSQRDELVTSGVRIFGGPDGGPASTVAQDLEPEYIAIAADGTTAYVALQENNAIAIVDIASATVQDIVPLGFKDHSRSGNGLDASNRDDAINIRTWPILGMYQPDALVAYTVDGETFLVSANEGHARDYDGFSEETRVADLALDPTAYPNAALLQDDVHLGCLKTTTATGDEDGDGDIDQIYSYGARSFSIWNAAGELVFDSGDDIGRITAALIPEGFNSNDGLTDGFDDRSDDKGAEPEGVALGTIGERTYAFIGLERTGGVMVYDITRPQHAFYVAYVNDRDSVNGTGSVAPEGLIFIPAADSPNGQNLVVVSNEISGTISIFSAVQTTGDFALTVLHNNDGESKLVHAGEGQEEFGGAARFKTLVDELKVAATVAGRGVLMLSSGDNFLAGPEFNASLQLPEGMPFFDGVAMDFIGYDAVAIGNHDFDFGPDVLAAFVRSYGHTQPPYLSANLDFSAEQSLQELVDQGRIAASVVAWVRGQRIGIVGATTPTLNFISSPRNVVINEVQSSVQAEIDALTADGIDKIIVISHLQGIAKDIELAGQLHGVDLMIAGGGDDLLANDDNALIPGDESAGPYPHVVQDADGQEVFIATTEGQYRYVGRLTVAFDDSGRIVSVGDDVGPVRVAGGSHADAVLPNPEVQAQAIDPVVAATADLAGHIVGVSEVALDGRRDQIRTQETNQGNLIADALLWQAHQLADEFGVKAPDVALQNGGGVRNASLIPAGDISELTTFSMVPFTNFLTVVADLPAAQFKEIMENAVSQVENTSGRFAQIAGFSMVWNPESPAQVLDDNGAVTTPGSRIEAITLDSGRRIVAGGRVVSDEPVSIVSLNFSVAGGDQYPFRGAPFVQLGITYQQALANYIGEALNGRITAAAYPAGGEGRIVTGPADVAEVDESRRAELVITVQGDEGEDVAGLTVQLSRAIAGRVPDYQWSATADESGTAHLTISGLGRRRVAGYYVAKAVDADGKTAANWHSIPVNNGRVIHLVLSLDGTIVSILEAPLAKTVAVPFKTTLAPNFPNPFNPNTQIAFTLAEPMQVRLTIYNVLGQQISTLAQGFHPAGLHQYEWNGQDDRGRTASSGIYFYRLNHAKGVLLRQMLLLK